MPIYVNRAETKDIGDDSFWKMDKVEKEPIKQRNTLPKDLFELQEKTKETTSFRVPNAGLFETSQRNKPSETPVPVTAKMTTAPKKEDNLLLSYEVTHSLILHVKIWHNAEQRSFFRNFISNAILSHKTVGSVAPYTPYYSFIPQYSQLTGHQKKYYFYFRDSARRGVYLPSDLSYIILYIYEIINLPTLIPPQEGLQIIWNLWGEYRSKYATLDRYLSEWVMDYCLIYQLSLPKNHPELIGVAFRNAIIPEFYLQESIEDDTLEPFAKALITTTSTYDYHKSRWYIPPYQEIFDEMIPKAIAASLRCMRDAKEGLFKCDVLRVMNVKKEAFCGTICEHNIKKKIDVKFYSMPRTKKQVQLITSLVKRAENAIRKANHLASVLKADPISPCAEEGLNQFFRGMYPIVNQQPEYERQYDAPVKPLSAQEAKIIEEQSWDTTNMLVQECEAEMPSMEEPKQEKAERNLSFFFRRILCGESFERISQEEGRFVDDFASEINEYAMDKLGDVVLENVAGKWSFVEDYREEVTQWSNM